MTPDDRSSELTWPTPNLGWIVSTLLRRRRVILLSAAVITVALITTVIVKGPLYKAEASLLVKLGRDSSASNPVRSNQTVMRTRRREDIATEVELLNSMPLMAEVVDAFGVDHFYARPPATSILRTIRYAMADFREMIVKQFNGLLIMVGLRHPVSRRDAIILVLRQAVVASSGNQSDVIQLSIHTRDPGSGVEILNVLIEHYMKAHIALQRTDKAEGFFKQKEARIHDEFEATAVALSAIRRKEVAWSIPVKQRLLRPHLQELRLARDNNAQHIKALRTEARSLDARLEVLGTGTDASPARGPNSPIDQPHEDSAGVLPNEDPVPEHVRLSMERKLRQAELDEALARGESLNEAVAMARAKLEHLNQVEARVRRLTRRLERLKKDREIYAQNLEQARIFAAMDLAEISNVSVLAPPFTSPRPVSPSMKVVAVAVVGGGLGLPVAVILLLGMLYPVARSAEDVSDHLQAPVLASFPDAGPLGTQVEAPMLIVPDALARESQRLAWVLLNHPDQPRSILLTGPEGAEGTTIVSVALARAIASISDESVLLVDACLRAPALHTAMGVELEPGILQWNGTDAPHYQPVPQMPSLTVLAAGGQRGPEDIEHPERLRQLFRRTREDFGFALWDSAPVTEQSDTLFITRHMDSVIAVVEADRTPIERLEYLRDQIGSVDGKVLGAVLNRTQRYWPWKRRTRK